MRVLVPVAIASVLALPACSASPAASFSGPVGQTIARSAAEARVPADLMAAIAHVEGGLHLAAMRDVAPDELVPVAGVLELRHGRFDSLARGAALTGASEISLQRDLSAGTAAGARVLADLAGRAGIDGADLAAWAPLLEELSGHAAAQGRADYRARVLAVLRAGGDLPARDGETIVIPPHPEIPIDLTFTPPGFAPQDTPDYAPATWFPTPSTNKWTAGRSGLAVTMIAVHDTEGGWDASVATLQNDSGKSVHYIVDADGSRVGQFVHEGDTAWHAGNWYYNQRMVGIEHVGYASGQYETAQYAASAALVRDVAARLHLGPNQDGTALDRQIMVGHQEVPDGDLIPESSPPCPDSPASCVADDDYGGASNHRDPGVHWQWCEYMEMIGGGSHCKCNDAYDLFNCVYDKSERVKCADGMNVVIDHCANDSCTVMPLGQDDVCGQTEPGSSSSSSGSATETGGAGGTGGATGTSSSGSSGSGGGRTSSTKAGCSCETTGRDGSKGTALGAALLALAVVRRRRATR